MKVFIVLAALIAIGSCSVLLAPQLAYATHGHLASQAVITPYAYNVPTSRFTRSDWVQPGALHAIPAVQRYTVTRPGFTTYHQAAPLVQQYAPLW